LFKKQILKVYCGGGRLESKISKPENVQDIISHLEDVDYPVTGKKFTEACNNMSDVSEEHRQWVRQNIDLNKTYASSEEIKKDLKL
jgi:hypothetical protein